MFVFIFFFKQKTAYEMRISDWSSDVCSSDLLTAGYILVFSTIIAFVVVPTVILFTGLISIWPLDRRDRREVDRISVQTFVRLVAAIILFSLVLGGWDKQHRPYEQSLNSLAGWFAFSFEMYRNDPCVRNKHERVRRIGDDVLVGHQQNGAPIFRIRHCKLVTAE